MPTTSRRRVRAAPPAGPAAPDLDRDRMRFDLDLSANPGIQSSQRVPTHEGAFRETISTLTLLLAAAPGRSGRCDLSLAVLISGACRPADVGFLSSTVACLRSGKMAAPRSVWRPAVPVSGLRCLSTDYRVVRDLLRPRLDLVFVARSGAPVAGGHGPSPPYGWPIPSDRVPRTVSPARYPSRRRRRREAVPRIPRGV